MSTKIGIVWNPSKIDEGELRSALEEALDEVFGNGDDAEEPEDEFDDYDDNRADDGDDAEDGAFGTDDDLERPEVLWFETSEDDPGQGAAGEALVNGCEVVIAAGGDGTVRAVAERLGRSGQAAADLGIVPAGTGNLLARNLGIPVNDTVEALVRVFADEAVPLDLGEARITLPDGSEERHGFAVMAGFGIDARMISETDDELKSKAGWLAYVESLGRAVTGAAVVETALSLDGGEARTVSAHTMLVGNCGTLMGGITLLPDAELDDGELDLLVLAAENVPGWLDTLTQLAWNSSPLKRLFSGFSGASESEPTVRARTIRVELPEPQEFEIDGDMVGRVSAFEARVLPGALSVRV